MWELTSNPIGSGNVNIRSTGRIKDNSPTGASAEIHKHDDVDVDDLSHHHTLGLGPGQAARGSDLKALADVVEIIAAGGATGPAGGDLSGTYPNPTIAAGAVGTTKLADSAVTNAKLANGSVDSSKLQGNSVDASKIVDGSVGNTELAASAVTTAKIADSNVTAGKLATDAVETAKIKDASVTDAKIAAVSQSKLTAAGAMTVPVFMDQIATPSTPAAGKNKLYFKADGKPYLLNSAGVEVPLVIGQDAILHPNPDFESWTGSAFSNWNGTFFSTGGPTVEQDLTTFVSGAKSFKTVVPATVGAKMVMFNQTDITISPFGTVEITVFAKGTGTNPRVRIGLFTDNAGGTDGTFHPGPEVPVDNVWRKYSAVFSVPPDHVAGNVYLEGRSSTNAGATLWFDSSTSTTTEPLDQDPVPWVDYSPVISNVATSGVIARYTVDKYNVVHVQVRFTLTGAPTGAVTISLPETAHASYAASVVAAVGTALGLRQGVGWQVGIPYLNTANTVAILYHGSAGGTWGPGTPVAWANTDLWGLEFSYEKA